MSIHYANELLPEVESSGIGEDERSSLSRIEAAIRQLEDLVQTEEEVTPLLLGKCARLVKHHRTLKYHFSVS